MDFNYIPAYLSDNCIVFDVFISTYRFAVQAIILPRWQTQKHADHQGEDVRVSLHHCL